MPDNASPNREKELFEQASDIPSLSERAGFLKGACGDDAALRQRLEALLLASEAPTGFLPDQPRAVPALGPLGTHRLTDLEKPGDQIGPYKLREKIGEGGCGVVYVAEQETPVRRRVALKVIKLGMDTRSVIARFDAEREALARMDHPNIARVLDAGATATGRPYFVMELVRGIPINAYCDQNNLPTAERLDLFIKVCHAVQHAHQKAIIHRDLKPSNILVTLHDGVPVPKVIDFGIAKATEGRLTDLTVYTELHQFIGTPAYTSPEQAEMSGLDIDTRSDIYSLGVLLYELLTGKTPFDAKELVAAGLDEMRRTIREKEPPRPSTRLSTMVAGELTATAKHRSSPAPLLVNQLRGDLDWVVMKCLEKDRARRYETATGLGADIQRYLGHEAVLACPPSTAYRVQKFVRRNRAAVAAVAAVVMVLLAGIAASTWHAVRATKAEHKEKTARTRAEAETKRADEQATIAKAVNDFLQNDLLRQAVSYEQADRGFEPQPDLTVKEALRRAGEKVGQRFTNQPLVEAEIRQTLGRTFYAVGEARQAIPHLERAVALRQQQGVPDNADTLMGMNNLAMAYRYAGRHADALPILEKTLKLQKAKLGLDHPDTLKSMNNLAFALPAGRSAEREQLFEETLKVRKAKLGPDHPDTLDSMSSLAEFRMARAPLETLPVVEEALRLRKAKLGPNHPVTFFSMSSLASAYQTVGRLPEAESLFVETLKLRQAKLGPDHPETLGSMGSLADFYQTTGRLTDALPLLEVALKLKRNKLGPDHPSTLGSFNTLVAAYKEAGRHTDALPLYEETLELRKAKLGPDHRDTLVSMNNLAVAYSAVGRKADAITLHEETLKLMKPALGLDHPSTLNSMNNLAFAHRADGRLTEALPLYEEVLKLSRVKLGPDHTNTLKSLSGLALTYKEAGRLVDAEPLFRELLELQRRRTNDPPRELASVALFLGGLQLKLGKFIEAEPLLRECLAIRVQHLPDEWLRFNAESVLGGALLGQKKLAEAEPLLRSGYAGIKAREAKIPSYGRYNLRDAIERLMQLAEAKGDPAQAAEWKQALAAFDQPSAQKPPTEAAGAK